MNTKECFIETIIQYSAHGILSEYVYDLALKSYYYSTISYKNFMEYKNFNLLIAST